jgi:hypothetical protein
MYMRDLRHIHVPLRSSLKTEGIRLLLLLFNPTHALTYTIKHQLTVTFKTLKNLLKTR